jgi:adenylate cyclase
VKLVFGEHYRRVAGPKNLDFIQKMSKGWSYFLLFTPESNAQARQMYEEAITIEPEAANAYDMLGWTHLFEVIFGVSKSPGKDMERAFELAQKAITLNDSVGSPHSLLGYIYLAKRQYEKAVAEVEQAVALSPNDADARAHMANIFNYVGKREEAINLSKQAIRLNPFPQSYYFTFLGEALCLAGQYEEAIKAYKKALHLNPKDSLSKPGLAVAYSLLGREKDARAMAAEILMTNPRFSVKGWAMAVPYKNRADITLFADTMRKVGLPD